jgi:hypothetical protein
MHIHLPKPLHGWREFIGEVGIIVIGVLIAMAAEQAVEALHWRHEVEAGREAVKSDLEDIVSQSLEREDMSACLGHRLQDIATILDQASASGQLPAIGPIGNPSKRLWHLQSWDSLMASQTATHFPKQEMLALGNLDAYLRTIDALNNQEMSDWTTLWTIVGRGRKLAVGEEPQLRQALGRAIYDAKLMRVGAWQMFDDIAKNHLLPNEDIAQIKQEAITDAKQYRQGAPVCNPIGAAPAHYGDSPLKLDLIGPRPPGV